MTGKVNFAKCLMAAVVVAALASVVCLGCGVKSQPIPPESARPEKILDLQASSTKTGIRLTWNRPENYAGGQKMRDLGSFTISRGETGGPFEQIGQIQVDDEGRFQVQRIFTLTDSAAVLGRTYHYQVISTTTDGYVSAPSNDVTVTRRVPSPPPNPENFVLPTPVPLP
jgi:hypothetical protein